MKATTEKAFEAYIQQTMSDRGWQPGAVPFWDKKLGVFPEYITNFIKDTQCALWEQMEKLHGDDLKAKIIEALVKERDNKGPSHHPARIQVLRKDISARLLQARTRSQSRDSGTLQEEQADCHPPSAVSPERNPLRWGKPAASVRTPHGLLLGGNPGTGELH
jgi:hypothetical protein